ncbi:class I SAM-dependent methyltransferase [Sulfurisphaera javensis]|uniref:Class I SAM-dependent methyltransferase n=1 Tax=Sulfurisphaera javensis TaxID=2049879 RepID=A0AAT9GRI6_9CREN
MSSFRIIKFNKYKLCINDETYEPSDDTELLLDILRVNKGEIVIDVGSGSGILGLHSLSLGAKEVFFVDINPYATEATLCTLKMYSFTNYHVINCDLINCIRDFEFDIAIFNPPYLPYEEYDKWIGYSWSGGKSGVDILVKFLHMIKAKRVYTLYSSLGDEEYLMSVIKKLKFRIVSKKERTIGFETLTALEIYNDKISNS